MSATVAARGAFHPELRTLARFAPRGNVTNAAGLKVMRQLTGLRRPSTTDVEDVSLGAAARMRLFRGAVKPVVAPALLWMHGGGYVMGNAHMGDRLCRASAEALDITVASVEYRLAPEHPYPAAVDDCETALRHLAALPGVDPERVAIGGVSSGAGLAAALAIRLRDTADITPVRQLLAYPMLDDRTSALSHRHDRQFRFWNRRSNEYGWAAYLADTDPNRVVPARCSDLRGLPPAWIGVGALDLLHDENVAFAERLRAAGVPCDLCVVRDAFHGFDAVAPKISGRTNVFRTAMPQPVQSVSNRLTDRYLPERTRAMTILADASRFFCPETIQDPYPLYDRMREQAPAHRIGESDFYAVCGWDAIVEAINRPDDFSANLTATMVYNEDGTVTPFHMGEPGGTQHALATADDPVHAEHRKILLPHLSAKRVRVIEQFAQHTAKQLWDDNLHDGHIEWMGAIANRLPMMVVAELLGLPDVDVDNLIRLGYATTTLLDGLVSAQQLEGAGMAALELSGYVMEHFEKASVDPQPGLISDLATRYAAGEVEQIVALGIMLTLFSAGGESTASLLGSAAWILSTKPDIQRQLRNDPKLLGAFIEETLRYESPFRGHYRHVWRDTALGGVSVPANSHLLLMWGAANRDPAQFEAPDEFRLDRGSAKGHITFEKGAHFCVGAALARLEAQIVLGMLLERTTWIEASDIGDWLPSILVRRLERLLLEVR